MNARLELYQAAYVSHQAAFARLELYQAAFVSHQAASARLDNILRPIGRGIRRQEDLYLYLYLYLMQHVFCESL